MGDSDKPTIKPVFKPSFGGQKKSAHAAKRQQEEENLEVQQQKQEQRAAGKGSKGGGKGGKGSSGGKGKGADGKGKGGKGSRPMPQGKAWLSAGSAQETAIRVKQPAAPSSSSSSSSSTSSSSSSQSSSKPVSAGVSSAAAGFVGDGTLGTASAAGVVPVPPSSAPDVMAVDEGDEDTEWAQPTIAENDPWAPVQVPFHKPAVANTPLFATPVFSPLNSSSSGGGVGDGGMCAAMPEEVLVAEEQDLYFMQLPTALPSLSASRLRTDRPGGLKYGMASSEASTSRGASGASGSTNLPPPPPQSSSSSSSSSSLSSTGSTALGGSGGSVIVPAGTGEHKQGALGELAEGFLGTIKVHASGRTVLHLGDSSYELRPGTRTTFAQQVVSVRTGAKPISAAGVSANQQAAAQAGAAAAAAFEHVDDSGGILLGADGSGGVLPSASSASSSQTAAAQAAAAEAVKALQAREEARMPRRYTVIGPITKRVVATPVLPPVHAS